MPTPEAADAVPAAARGHPRHHIGITPRSAQWVKQAEIDAGETPGASSAEQERIKRLEQENRELKRANAILKSSAAFFAAELDRPQR